MRSDNLKTSFFLLETRLIFNFAVFYMLLIGMWYINKSSLVIEVLFYMGKSANTAEGPTVKIFTTSSFTYQPQ